MFFHGVRDTMHISMMIIHTIKICTYLCIQVPKMIEGHSKFKMSSCSYSRYHTVILFSKAVWIYIIFLILSRTLNIYSLKTVLSICLSLYHPIEKNC